MEVLLAQLKKEVARLDAQVCPVAIPPGPTPTWKPPISHPHPESGGSLGFSSRGNDLPNKPSWGPSISQLPLASICM